MTIDERLCKFQGKCWHLWEYDWRGLQICSKCGIDRIYSSIKNNYVNDNLDFSSDHTAMELLRWFERERKDMCEAFQKYFPLTAYDFSIFLERKGKSYMRWVVLLYEWLGLEETREKWGWEECPCVKEGDGFTDICCRVCNGSGKLLAPWLEERLANA